MADKEVVDYIKSTLTQGFTEDQVKFALISSGHSESDINEALSEAKSFAPIIAPEHSTVLPVTHAVSQKGKRLSKKAKYSIAIFIVMALSATVFFSLNQKTPVEGFSSLKAEEPNVAPIDQTPCNPSDPACNAQIPASPIDTPQLTIGTDECTLDAGNWCFQEQQGKNCAPTIDICNKNLAISTRDSVTCNLIVNPIERENCISFLLSSISQ